MMRIGDKVRIIKKFKSKEIEYLSIMDKYIGQVGEFVCNDIDNTRIIKFSDGESFIWYPECLELVEDYRDKTTDRFDEVSEEAYKSCADLEEDKIAYPPNEKLKQAAYDYINPSHYTKYTFEAIDMMEKIYGSEWVAIYCELTIFKYRMRMGDKPNEPVDRDMKKVKWYEEKMKELREKLK